MVDEMKKEHWIVCPFCQSNTHIKIYEDTVLLNFPVYCDSCQKELIINVVKCRLQLKNESCEGSTE